MGHEHHHTHHHYIDQSQSSVPPPPLIGQGESLKITLNLIDQFGNPIDLTNVVGIEAETRIDNILSRRYSDAGSPPTDYYTITKTGVSIPNQISFYISRQDSLQFTVAGRQVHFNILIKNPDGSTPLYYSLTYVIAITKKGYLQNSSL